MKQRGEHGGDDDQRDVDGRARPAGGRRPPCRSPAARPAGSTGTPMLPPPALRPSAQPFFRSGKKALMLVIDEAKLPPPTPASAADHQEGGVRGPGLHHDARGDGRHQQQQRADRPSSCARRTAPRRRCTGTRTTAPTSVAIATRKNFPAGSTPYSGPHEQHHHRPQGPDGEPDVLGEHGEAADCGGRSARPSPARSSRPPGPTARSTCRPSRLHGLRSTGVGSSAPTLGSARFGAVP